MTRLASPDSISQHAVRRSEPSGAELTVVLKPDAPKSAENVKFLRNFQDKTNGNGDTDVSFIANFRLFPTFAQ